MTEAELWHMMLLAAEDLSANLETLLTVVFAYLATAHFAGKKLSQFQAVLVSVFFVLAAGTAGFMALVMWRRTAYFMGLLISRFHVESFAPNQFLIVLFAMVLALLIPACVYFMYQSRRHGILAADGG
jgi:hypothetical protein